MSQLSLGERIETAVEDLTEAWGEEKVAALLEETASLAKRAKARGNSGAIEARAVLHRGAAAEVWCNGVRVA